MKLIVTEVGSLGRQGDRSFKIPVVKVGRDNDQCQIVFDRVTWPMVSRYHGEFRLEDGKCFFVDANSTFGTFVNGQRMKGAAEVGSGSLIQFGAGGPVLRVRSVEASSGILQAHEVVESCADISGESQAISTPLQSTATLELEGGENHLNARIRLESETTSLGRDPASALPLNSASVSRHHAEIRRNNGHYVLVDLASYNGTFVNGQRIGEPTVLSNNDRIQLGVNGPIFRLINPTDPRGGDGPKVQDEILCSISAANRSAGIERIHETLVATPDVSLDLEPARRLDKDHTQPVLQWAFNKPYISVGRGPGNDIRLDSFQISVHHARFIRDQNGVLIEDRGSTNGVYVNGERITHGRRLVELHDVVQIGPFLLQADPTTGVAVFDTRSKTRIDVININKIVAQRLGESQKLLDGINLAIQPNEFIGLLGSSGAGKSTLMNVLNGMSSPSTGEVLINDLNLFRHLDSLKHLIGYVPQDDIIHRELSVYRTLLYVARLRLSRDVSRDEVDEIIDEVLDVTGLTERRDVPVGRLSGGQRKRVSIAVELITKPSIIYLDEPTSGLDPATEEKIMKLFRRITESGRTVVLTTHNTVNVHLFDKIVVLMQGKLVFYGSPAEALAHFKVKSFNDLYDALQAPAKSKAKPTILNPQIPNEWMERVSKQDGLETIAERWRLQFQESELYRTNIERPLRELNPVQRTHPITQPRVKIADSVRQWITLVRRYIEILLCDRGTLIVLLGQSPVIALLTYLVIDEKATRDFPYFMLALVATWFGTSVSAREIVRERAVYNRERMFNLRLFPYVASKITVLAAVVSLQCFLLLSTLKVLHYAHFTYLPGSYSGLPHLLVMILTGTIGVALGLLVSAIVRSSQTATSLVPLLLIPQILFSGLVGVPKGIAKVAGATMPVTWSFDQMKRFSKLQSLNEEGSIAIFLEAKSKQQTEAVQLELQQFNSEVDRAVGDYGRRTEEYMTNARSITGLERPKPPVVPTVPHVSPAQAEDDLKEFVSFTHPWGSTVINSLVLFLMLAVMIVGTITMLRLQDKG